VQHNKDTFDYVNLVDNCASLNLVHCPVVMLHSWMETLFPFLTPFTLIAALFIALGSGFVKGVVGFAMPLVLISGLTLFLPPETALAGLILPTLVTNIRQSLRQGLGNAWGSIVDFRVFLVVGATTLVISAQFVRLVPTHVLQLVIGVPVMCFAVLQLTGHQFRIKRRTTRLEATVGGLSGVLAGLSGVWGPPTVSYLTALNTPKDDQMRIQGVIYGGGAIALFGAHMGSGVLRGETVLFSALLILPALIGMWIGSKIMARFDQRSFRRATLAVLLVGAVNLVRRGLF
jgi:uncharacterized membrane protein YfcA